MTVDHWPTCNLAPGRESQTELHERGFCNISLLSLGLRIPQNVSCCGAVRLHNFTIELPLFFVLEIVDAVFDKLRHGFEVCCLPFAFCFRCGPSSRKPNGQWAGHRLLLRLEMELLRLTILCEMVEREYWQK